MPAVAPDPVGEALYRGVLEDPAADALRLVYADWLEENGEPDRAAFVRVQCEMAALGAGGAVPADHHATRPDGCACRWCELGRAAAWAGRRAEGWLPDTRPLSRGFVLHGGLDGVDARVVFRVGRGFVSEARLSLASLEKRAAPLFAAHPVERFVIFRGHVGLRITPPQAAGGPWRVYPGFSPLRATTADCICFPTREAVAAYLPRAAAEAGAGAE